MLSVEEYIESGMIEACLMGQASAEEVAELNRLSAQHPEIAREVEAVRATLDGLLLTTAADNAKAPPPALKSKILAAAQAAVQETPPAPPMSPVAPAPRAGTPIWPWAITGLTAAAAVVGWFMYSRQAQMVDLYAGKAQACTTAQDSLAAQNNLLVTRYDSLHTAYDTLWMRSSHKVEMNDMGKHPQGRAFVYWNDRTGEVKAAVAMLPPPPAGMEYQLWAIVDSKPVDLGMLHMEGEAMAMAPMKPVMNAQAFAVTLEKAGGSPTPTMDQMYVHGQV